MIRFSNDYSEGAHPKILEKLIRTNEEQTPGYSEDDYCRQAANLIRKQCRSENAAVHFIPGGTQTNLIVISAALRPHQCVISAASGHINIHETGAIEATGHKVLALPHNDGKINADQIEHTWLSHIHDESFEHIAQPKMVYISNPTEYGTIYSRKELAEISRICRKYGLYLYLDGARLGYGLCAPGNDLDLPSIAECCDVFYIGGTKIGALFGEAVVILHEELKRDFRYIIKQKGAMLAKGWLMGLQFIALFEDNLYFRISEHAVNLAQKVRAGFAECGYPFLYPSPTNQQFPILPNALLPELSEKYAFSHWQKYDEYHTVTRFCTSWATQEAAVAALCADLSQLHK